MAIGSAITLAASILLSSVADAKSVLGSALLALIFFSFSFVWNKLIETNQTTNLYASLYTAMVFKQSIANTVEVFRLRSVF